MRLLLVTLGLCISISSFANDNIVILLSWDGMRHDFPDRGNFPALKRIEQEGIRAGRLTPVYLSNTFPGHVSLATGAEPHVHGIVDNVFIDREKGLYAYSSDADWITAEPLWIAAERQGIRTATYFWVGSESDWQGQATSYRMAPFDASRPESTKVDKIIEWLELPAAEQPKLIMSYWRGADSVAHLKGPDHDDVVGVIAEQDLELQRLLAHIDQRQLWSKTTLIIVSDHGMTPVTESVEVKTALEDAGLSVKVTGGEAAQHLFLESPADLEAVRKVLANQPHIQIFEGEDIPIPLAAPNRTGDIVVTTQPPYSLGRAESFTDKLGVFLAPLLGWSRGAHGYNPALEDMGGIFFAMGNGVAKGKKIEDVHQLEVAPTVARLLGIKPPQNASLPSISLD